VGLVYIAVVAERFERVERFVWQADREGNKWASSEAALQMVVDYLRGKIEN
jgi:nicotinamide mononucleotide (NMN) deamidase PncC